MRDFFRGWRRKVGCVALVIGLLFAGAWMRSRMQQDTVSVEVSGYTHFLVSANGKAWWWTAHPTKAGTAYYWNIGPLTQAREGHYLLKSGPVLYAFEEGQAIAVPYWLFSIPLILFGTYLILWKPRDNPDA